MPVENRTTARLPLVGIAIPYCCWWTAVEPCTGEDPITAGVSRFTNMARPPPAITSVRPSGEACSASPWLASVSEVTNAPAGVSR